jgi:hypothetical protein
MVLTREQIMKKGFNLGDERYMLPGNVIITLNGKHPNTGLCRYSEKCENYHPNKYFCNHTGGCNGDVDMTDRCHKPRKIEERV